MSCVDIKILSDNDGKFKAAKPDANVDFMHKGITTFGGEIQKLKRGVYFFNNVDDAFKFNMYLQRFSYEKSGIVTGSVPDSILAPTDFGLGRYSDLARLFPKIEILIDRSLLYNYKFQPIDAIENGRAYIRVTEDKTAPAAYHEKLCGNFKQKHQIDLEAAIIDNTAFKDAFKELSQTQIGETVQQSI
jgi:hypothetical protein